MLRLGSAPSLLREEGMEAGAAGAGGAARAVAGRDAAAVSRALSAGRTLGSEVDSSPMPPPISEGRVGGLSWIENISAAAPQGYQPRTKRKRMMKKHTSEARRRKPHKSRSSRHRNPISTLEPAEVCLYRARCGAGYRVVYRLLTRAVRRCAICPEGNALRRCEPISRRGNR